MLQAYAERGGGAERLFFSALCQVRDRIASILPSHLKYRSIAVGGTFDQIHKGHKALLDLAFGSAEIVYIGLTSDEFVKRSGKQIRNDFEFRNKQLVEYLNSTYPQREYVLTKLEAPFGPGMYTSEIEAIAVSSETLPNLENLNKRRKELGLPELSIEVVSLVPADDGRKISSTRIRAGEIDAEGRMLQ